MQEICTYHSFFFYSQGNSGSDVTDTDADVHGLRNAEQGEYFVATCILVSFLSGDTPSAYHLFWLLESFFIIH